MKLTVNKDKTKKDNPTLTKDNRLRGGAILCLVVGAGFGLWEIVSVVIKATQGLHPDFPGLLAIGALICTVGAFLETRRDEHALTFGEAVATTFICASASAIVSCVLLILASASTFSIKDNVRESLLVEQGYESVKKIDSAEFYAEKDGKAYNVSIEQEGTELFTSREETEKDTREKLK